MFSSLLARRVPGALSSVKSVIAPSISVLPGSFGLFQGNAATQPPVLLGQPQQQQVRWVTKRRQYRQLKKQRKAALAAKGIFPPKPHNYIPKDTPVLNAVSREERDAESKRQDEIAAKELQAKMQIVKAPPMRFGLYGEALRMSDRVRKLFDLHNGNQKEVVQAQKQRGMEIFQLREADTGSSSVQGRPLVSFLFPLSFLFLSDNLS